MRAAPSLGSELRQNTIETVTVPKKRAKTPVKKVYPPHECFGSPLNKCRICGEKYTYVIKPYGAFESNAPKAEARTPVAVALPE